MKRLHTFVALILIALAAIIVYAGSLRVPFHFDDSHTIEQNTAVQTLGRIPEYFGDASTFSVLPENRSYRPLTSVGFALSYAVGHGATWPFHVFKIAMHVISCFLIFLIWRELFGLPGWLPTVQLTQARLPGPELAALVLALVFAVHPANTETVTYISANTHLQASVLYLAAVWCFLQGRRHASWILGAALAYIAAVLSKEEAITFPATAGVLAFILSRKSSFESKLKDAILRTLPYWVLFVLLAALIYFMTPASWAKSRGSVTRLDYLLTQTRAWLWYIRLWLWPFDLNADNVAFEFSHSLRDPRVIQALIGNSLVAAFCWFNRKRLPALFFGFLWFFITISPASSIMPLAEPVNEHRMYLAYAGIGGGLLSLTSWLAWSAFRPGPSSKTATALTTILLVTLGFGAIQRIDVWKTSESLWTDTVEKNPTSGRALNNLALVYMQRADYSKALSLLSQCEQHWNRYVYCPLNEGIIYLAQGRASDAQKSLSRALALDPENIYANFHMGRYYRDYLKDNTRAAVYFQRFKK